MRSAAELQIAEDPASGRQPASIALEDALYDAPINP